MVNSPELTAFPADWEGLSRLEDQDSLGLIWDSWIGRPERPKKRPRERKYKILGEVRDVDGILWAIREYRETRHGFSLCLGNRMARCGQCDGGLPRLIATEALRDFWEANKVKSHGFLYDLPAGRTTLKRMRKKLGFNHREATEEFWIQRLEDLTLLPASEFAVKHGVKKVLAFDRRTRMVGRRARQIGWWRTAKVQKILLSGLTLAETGRKLGVGTSQAWRLKRQALAELEKMAA
jgi:hypothetical protein